MRTALAGGEAEDRPCRQSAEVAQRRQLSVVTDAEAADRAAQAVDAVEEAPVLADGHIERVRARCAGDALEQGDGPLVRDGVRRNGGRAGVRGECEPFV